MKNRWKENMFRLTEIFEESHILGAVRQGLLMMMPLIMAGSVALMLRELPVQAYQDALPRLAGGRYLDILNYIYAGTLQFFSVALAVAISVSYASIVQSQQESNETSGDCIILPIITLMSLAGYIGIQYDGFRLNMFGTMHTFTAVFVSIISCRLYYKLKEKEIAVWKNAELDGGSIYGQAVRAIVPAVLIVLFFAAFNMLLQLVFGIKNVYEGLEKVSEVFMGCFHHGFTTGIVIILLTHAMWFLGIHGGNVLDSVVQSHYTAIDANHIYSKTFQDVFVIIGGVGAALSFLLAILVFSKNKNMRRVAKLACPTVPLNISEVLSFGVPLIFNPIFLIPFICVPIVNHIIAYAAIYLGLVPHVIKEVSWTTPVLLGGYQATGSIAGSVLQIVCVVAGMFLYLPFIRLYEEHQELQMKKRVGLLVSELQKVEQANSIKSLTNRTDVLGTVARILAADLEDAIEDKKLFLMYQPQVDQQEICIGAEALVRWIHPKYGFIYPPLIIQLAKEKHMLHLLEQHIFDMAAETIARVEDEVGGEFKISVNITNESLAWSGFENCIGECVERHHIARNRMWLEITEQDALYSSDDITEKVETLKKMGHQFLIDDFGMGHTSLIYLQTNYFGIVKLDGSLTRDILENNRNRDIIASIVYLGHSLHFTTVAEYVETKEQRDALAEIGVDAFQGYLYSKPVRQNELIPWMLAHKGGE